MAYLYRRGEIFWVKYSAHGIVRRVSLKTKDKKVASFRKNEIENGLAVGSSPILDKPPIPLECFDQFIKSRAGIVSSQTDKTDLPRIRAVLNIPGIYRLNDITEATLKAHLDRRIKDGISHRTANHTIRAVTTFLNFCVKRKMIASNPLAGMTRYPVDKTPPYCLTDAQLAALMAASKSSPIHGMIMTALYAGLRLGEIERLAWKDVDFNADTIRVMVSKSRQHRLIPLHPALKAVLSHERNEIGPCFPMRNREAFNWQFERVNAAMGESGPVRFHDLRHTFASRLIKSGVDIYTVSKFLGHSSVKVTEIYSHLYQDHAAESMRKLRF